MIGERKKVSEAFSVANQDYFEELIKKRLKTGYNRKESRIKATNRIAQQIFALESSKIFCNFLKKF